MYCTYIISNKKANQKRLKTTCEDFILLKNILIIMTEHKSFILSTVENGILKVVFNRPDKKNALSVPMYTELTSLLNDSAKNDQVLVFALTGMGNIFSSGNDLNNALSEGFTPETLQNFHLIFKKFVEALITYPKLLVAVVNGPAIGIACTMLGLFDIVYASDKAYFQTPFTNLGLVAEGCSTYIFPKLLGFSKTGEMLYLNYKMSAHEAEQHGFVSKVYNHNVLENVWDYLNKISSLSSESILATKRLVNKWNKDILLKVNEEEVKELQKRSSSADLAERMLNFFMRKSKL